MKQNREKNISKDKIKKLTFLFSKVIPPMPTIGNWIFFLALLMTDKGQ